ncbi:hypothetical protein C9422_18315 [Pseudomonas sp. B1(2018)]|uniref:hypothetical protein n=1 Tax=Pseudomonas sp. B1(2018) TaxID=2233856 RepID=UPI000D5EBB18|nr:hypothetical protein [Pseudomonas sp. B1(2018)]PVZ56488.1 hypothetical protein C9422_18315 [Pseudomonas sp. B1(2018)]
MSDVSDFTVVDGLGNYDREANPQGLSVWELLPKEVSWSFWGRLYKIESAEKLIPQLLIGGTGIAVVVSPFNAEKNKALVVKPDGEVMWDVSALAGTMIKGGVFSDVYYVSGLLCFFVNINDQDFRFSFDAVSGEIGVLTPSY